MEETNPAVVAQSETVEVAKSLRVESRIAEKEKGHVLTL